MGPLMDQWLLVVISWGIVLPILAFWASYVVVSSGMRTDRLRPRRPSSRHRPRTLAHPRFRRAA